MWRRRTPRIDSVCASLTPLIELCAVARIFIDKSVLFGAPWDDKCLCSTWVSPAKNHVWEFCACVGTPWDGSSNPISTRIDSRTLSDRRVNLFCVWMEVRGDRFLFWCFMARFRKSLLPQEMVSNLSVHFRNPVMSRSTTIGNFVADINYCRHFLRSAFDRR